VRTTVAEMGPLLFSRLMELTRGAGGCAQHRLPRADEEGLPLLDLKDLQALLVWVGENREELSCATAISRRVDRAIQRRLLVLENQGGGAALRGAGAGADDLLLTAPTGAGGSTSCR
jgi:hypothetical protein